MGNPEADGGGEGRPSTARPAGMDGPGSQGTEAGSTATAEGSNGTRSRQASDEAGKMLDARQSWTPRPPPDPWADGSAAVRAPTSSNGGEIADTRDPPAVDDNQHKSPALQTPGGYRPSLATLQPPPTPASRGDYFSGDGSSPSDRERSTSSLAQPSPVDINVVSPVNGYSSSSSISRASSARSTSSVQAVPLRTPLRTPARSPALSRTTSQAAAPRPTLVPAFLFRPGSTGGTPAADTPPSGGKNSPQGLSELGGARVPAPLAETSREYAPSLVSPTSTVTPLPPHAQPTSLNPPHSARHSFLNSLTRTSSNTSGEPDGPVLPRPPASKEAFVRTASEERGHQSGGFLAARPELTKLRTPSSTSLAGGKSSADFNFGDVLGEGSYSTVYHATDVSPPHREYAIKVLDKRHISKEKKVKYVAVERDTLNRLDRHPGCLRLYWTFQDANCLYYVLEYAAKGEILKAIKQYGSFSPECARFYAAQILSAVEHMHSRGVIHRDVKPENILLDENMRVKMADFGSAKILKDPAEGDDQERAHSFVGTAEYVSPELLTDKVSFKSSDFWAFGCVVYQFLAGHPPFKSRSEYLTFQKITNLDYELPEAFPEEAQDLIRRLLVLNPEDRLGARRPDGIEAIKRHPFFEGIDWSTLWTVTPPPLKTGLTPPRPPPPPTGATPPMGAGVASPRGFSGLAMDSEDDADQSEVSSVNGGPRAEDAPREAPQKLNGLPTRATWLASRRGSRAAAPSPPAPSGMTWVDMFLPNELLIYSSSIIEKRGLFSKKRTLVVTDYPRLLCVKEDKSSVRVKHEILFRPLPDLPPAPTTAGGGHHRRGPGKDGQFPIFRSVTQENHKTFWVHASHSKPIRFEDPSGDAERWTAELKLAASRAVPGHPS